MEEKQHQKRTVKAKRRTKVMNMSKSVTFVTMKHLTSTTRIDVPTEFTSSKLIREIKFYSQTNCVSNVYKRNKMAILVISSAVCVRAITIYFYIEMIPPEVH